VDIADSRISSFVSSELQSLKFEVEQGGSSVHGVELFVLDDAMKLPGVPIGSRVVFLGSHEQNGNAAQVRSLGCNPKISDIRKALREIGRSSRPEVVTVERGSRVGDPA
jgi:hypothetical protein